VRRAVPGRVKGGVRARSGSVVVSWNFELPLIQINDLNERVSFDFSPAPSPN
jgi:hypothetical protein